MVEKKEKHNIIENAQLMSEWNWERNTDFDPPQLTLGSNKKVWWKCQKGHEWQASISHRNNGMRCPYCVGRYAVNGENDLQTVNPTLAKEWNYERNNGLTPIDVLPNSDKKVWWKCSKGHEWQAIIGNRNKGQGCPYCAGRKVLKGYNDLQAVNPTVASEWNYEKNNGLTPAEVMPNSNKKAWWKCKQRHEWQATINSRNNGVGCPFCSGKSSIKGYNDLQTINPVLATEWHYEKNSGLTPSDVMPKSGKKVWWKCKKGHEWQASVVNRNKGSACPYCAGQRALKCKNDLQTVNPALAKEWNYEKNANLTPADVLPNSGKKVWWRCSKGHEWEAVIQNRTNGRGCPYCYKEKRKKKE